MTIRETVVEALSYDVPRSQDDIIVDTGLEPAQVSGVLHQLKGTACKRVAEGWLRVASTASTTPPPAVVAASTPPAIIKAAKRRGRPRKKKTDTSVIATPAAAQAKRPTKRRTKRRVAKVAEAESVTATAGGGHAGSLSFVLTERMEIGLERIGVPGKRGLLSVSEAIRLHSFIASVLPALRQAL